MSSPDPEQIPADEARAVESATLNRAVTNMVKVCPPGTKPVEVRMAITAIGDYAQMRMRKELDRDVMAKKRPG